MKTKYTAGQFRRGQRRIAKNAQTVTDNFGTTYRITASRRILSVYNPMAGAWESPSAADGVRRGSMRYTYLTGAFSKASATLYSA